MIIENKIVITSTFIADPIKDSIQFWLEKLQMTGQVVLAPPFQVLQTLVDPTSILRANAAGLNVILVRWTDLTHRDQFSAGAPAEDLAAALRSCVSESRVPHLVILCSSPTESGRSSPEQLHRDSENQLIDEFDSYSNVFVMTTAEIQSLYPVVRAHDSYGDGLAALPFTPAMFAAIGTMIARKYHMLNQPPYKVIAVDCDNTLWSGVCGEDGPEGIIFDEPRLTLQEHLLDQYQKGTLLCLCSKNNAEDVLAVFHGRREMSLRLEHFISQRINWEPKTENLQSLARELGLSTDSFIFLDDDPVECEAMRATLPEALTLQMPARPADIPEFLRHIWAFDRPKATKEDQQRTAMYHHAKERENLRKTVATIEDFLAGLDLTVDFQSVLNETHLARASQLTFRVNQFNLTTIRRTEAELAAMLKQQDFTGFLINARDRFGDYGIVGLILLKWGFDRLAVDTFVLSCRALGRGVEHRVVAELASLAQARGLKTLVLRLRITSKNQPASDFLQTEFATYLQPDGESQVYQIPVEIAQDAHPRSRAAGPAVIETPPRLTLPQQEGDHSAAARSFQLAEITSTLTYGDKILSHIESWKRNSRSTAAIEGIAPRNEIEQTLAKIWADILGWETVGIRDNFLTLGGDSLKMVQVIVRIYGQFGVEFPISSFFESPTVEAQALILAEQIARKTGS